MHFSDGILPAPLPAGGFAAAGALASRGARSLRDPELPRIAVHTRIPAQNPTWSPAQPRITNRFLLLLVLLGLTAAPALAHRLTVDWQVVDRALVLVGHTDGQPAVNADVQVRSAAGAVLAEGLLDATGTFRWPLSATGDVTVVVSAGLGHRRTLVLSAAELDPGPAPAPTAPRASTSTGGTGAHGSSDGSSPLAVRVVVGLTFLLAAAAAGLGWSNRRRLAQLEQRWNQHESRG